MDQELNRLESNQYAQEQSEIPGFALFDLLMGEWVTRCIHVAADIGLADALGDSPKSVQELAQATNTHAPSLYRLLRCLASKGIFVETEPNCFAQTELSNFLRSDQPGSLAPLARHYGSEWQWSAWGELEYSIRTGKPAAEHVLGQKLWEYLKSHPQDGELYHHAMTGASRIINDALVHVYDFSPFNVIVDVGGGQGSLLKTILASHPALSGILFDQAQVIEKLHEHMPSEFRARIELVAGDFFVDVPKQGDAYILKQVLHDWSDEDCIRILKACRKAMKPGSRLLVMDGVIQPGGAETTFAKLTDLVMLLVHGGRERTTDEIAHLFENSGFKLKQVVATGTPISITEGIPI